jgi:hypothetical protein
MQVGGHLQGMLLYAVGHGGLSKKKEEHRIHRNDAEDTEKETEQKNRT